LFNIQFPIIQAGMVWCSGWRLASAVSNAGGLGLIGSGSMSSEILREHITKCKNSTVKPFGVNLPLIYSEIEEHIKVIIEEGVQIVFTSAGNPKTWTNMLKKKGIKVAHVVSSFKFAKKSEEAGVDAIVAEGFEAGGHNGKDETTTLCLIPNVIENTKLPVIAAGGIVSGRSMLAVMALGADAVQIGSRFVASAESSAHINFKKKIISLKEGDTQLSLKKLIPVRLIKNDFYNSVQFAEDKGASQHELSLLLGKGRSKQGMFLGDISKGELEIGQASSMITDIKPAAEILHEIWDEYIVAKKRLCTVD
jgi:enoyl-[acyl-carrier protein] reductase II